jgi:putative copper resistance protein D
VASWIAKVLLYIATAISVGGSFSYLLLSKYAAKKNSPLNKTIINYMMIGAIMGVCVSVFGFLIQVGSFANAGWLGMFDPTFFKILINTPVGAVQIVRAVCFFLIAVLLVIKYYKKSAAISYASRLLMLLLLLGLVVSFSQVGHVTNLPIFAQVLISLHVATMSLWMGALFPLWRLSKTVNGMPLKETMHLFGRLAAVIVGVLVVCGITVAYLLLKDIHTLISTPYGHGFIIKLILIASILLLAAFNKWYFTPRLQYAKYAKQLSYAILVEMFLGLSILLVTGYITSVIGIE